MDHIREIILGIIIIIALITTIKSYIDGKKYKEIRERGTLIAGTVVKIKEHRDKHGVKTGDCSVVVSFAFNKVTYSMKASSVFNNWEYSVGDKIDLLFLEEFPNKVIAISKMDMARQSKGELNIRESDNKGWVGVVIAFAIIFIPAIIGLYIAPYFK